MPLYFQEYYFSREEMTGRISWGNQHKTDFWETNELKNTINEEIVFTNVKSTFTEQQLLSVENHITKNKRFCNTVFMTPEIL